jgi:hypothetical protein
VGDARRHAGDRSQPDFGANIDRLFTERSAVMQAWGAYGVLWPVITQWLGVSPDLGRGRLAVVPQLPAKQTKASVNTVKLGMSSIDVIAEHQGGTYTTTVTRHGRMDLRIGAVLPRWGDGRVGYAQRLAGQAQAGEDSAGAGSRHLRQAGAAYGHSGDQHRELILELAVFDCSLPLAAVSRLSAALFVVSRGRKSVSLVPPHDGGARTRPR